MERFTLPFEEPIREIEKEIEALLAAPPARSEAERQQAKTDYAEMKASFTIVNGSADFGGFFSSSKPFGSSTQ